MNIKSLFPDSVKKWIKSNCMKDKTKDTWSLNKIEEQIKIDYKNHMGTELDLQNPVLFTEKIQWLKLYYN